MSEICANFKVPENDGCDVVKNIAIISPPESSSPYIREKNIAPTASMTQVPSILSVAPSGMEILQTFGEIPSFSRQAFRLCGMEALLDANTKDISIDGAYFL